MEMVRDLITLISVMAGKYSYIISDNIKNIGREKVNESEVLKYLIGFWMPLFQISVTDC
jgi:hypothetical protein